MTLDTLGVIKKKKVSGSRKHLLKDDKDTEMYKLPVFKAECPPRQSTNVMNAGTGRLQQCH